MIACTHSRITPRRNVALFSMHVIGYLKQTLEMHMLERSNEVESLSLEPGRTEVVRLMNLHKAKSLEAPVVFLAEPAGGVTPRADVQIERTDLGARGWLKIVRKSEGSFAANLLGEHKDWEIHEAAELPYVQAEEDRLLYVAATRAREELVVSRSTENPRTPAWGVLNKFLTGVPELTIPESALVSPIVPLDCLSAMQVAAASQWNMAYSLINQPSWGVR
jgi:ATP-dependent helicase/nuclease subunit A